MAIVKINERSKFNNTVFILDEVPQLGNLESLIKLNEIGRGQDEMNEWEAELDMLGTNSETEKYVEMLEKAPPHSRSLATLQKFVQARVSA